MDTLLTPFLLHLAFSVVIETFPTFIDNLVDLIMQPRIRNRTWLPANWSIQHPTEEQMAVAGAVWLVSEGVYALDVTPAQFAAD